MNQNYTTQNVAKNRLHQTKFSSSLVASASTSPLMKPFEAWTELLYIVAMIPIHKPKRTKKKERKFINNQYVAKINLYLLN